MTSEKIKAKRLADWLALPEVRLRDVRPGDVLVTDGDFTCTRHWSEHVVEKNAEGALFIRCRSGEHTLDGQLACDSPGGDPEDDTLVGLRCMALVT